MIRKYTLSILKKQDDTFINLLKEAKNSLNNEPQGEIGAYNC